MPLLAMWHRRRPERPRPVPDGEGLDICSVADLDCRGRVVVSLPDPAIDVLVVKTAGGVYALDNYCPHTGAALEGGAVHDATIRCAAHGLRFDLVSGRCVSQRRGQTPPLTTMRAWIADGRVLVAVRSGTRTLPA
jgi:nitrite reductase/ring-hydroxylating ferredoxin subunit